MESVALAVVGLLQTAAVVLAVLGAIYLIALRWILSAGRKAGDHSGNASICTSLGKRFSISYEVKKKKLEGQD